MHHSQYRNVHPAFELALVPALALASAFRLAFACTLAALPSARPVPLAAAIRPLQLLARCALFSQPFERSECNQSLKGSLLAEVALVSAGICNCMLGFLAGIGIEQFPTEAMQSTLQVLNANGKTQPGYLLPARPR